MHESANKTERSRDKGVTEGKQFVKLVKKMFVIVCRLLRFIFFKKHL